MITRSIDCLNNMFKQFYISIALCSVSLTLGACTSKAQANDDPKTNTVVVYEALSQDVEPYTLEEIREEQKTLEAQIANIRAKGELERADKVVLVKLKSRLLNLKNKEVQIQEQTITNYDIALDNLSKVSSKVKN